MNAPTGYEIIVAQINASLADALSWAKQMTAAMSAGDLIAMQIAADRVHTSAQTAQVLAHSVERRISTHRKRKPHA